MSNVNEGVDQQLILKYCCWEYKLAFVLSKF